MFDGKGLVPVYVMEDIAKAIRSKMKEQNLYKPTEMAAAIRSMTPYFYDTTGTFYILSPDYWNIHVNQSEHQTISYSASGEAVMKGVDKWASRLFINSRIVANEGFTPGTIHKTIDSTNHDIVLMAEPATPIADMVKDGVLLVYCNSKDYDNYYTQMYWKRDETTKKDVLTFEGKVDLGNVDIPIRVIGADANLIDKTGGFGIGANTKGFENDITLTWKSDSLNNNFQGDDITGDKGFKLEYIKMPNLTHFERKADLGIDMPSLKSVNFENLEFINTEYYAQGYHREISFCSIIHPYDGKPFQLTDVNFTQLKMAYCNLLENCGATRLGLPNLEVVMRFSKFPYLEDISLPKLTECLTDLLCYCPKLKVVKLPMLEKCGGELLQRAPIIEEIEFDKLVEIPKYFLDSTYHYNTPSPNLRSVILPEAKLALGTFLIGQNSPNFTAISLPKLQTANGDFLVNDSTLQKIELPEFVTASGKFFTGCSAITAISLPKLQTANGDFLVNDSAIETVNVPALASVSGNCLYKCNSIKTVSFPELTTVGKEFAVSQDANYTLQEINAPKLKTTGNLMWNICGITSVSFPALEEVNGYFIDGSDVDFNLVSIDAPLLETVTGDLVHQNTQIESLDLPSLKTIGGSLFNAYYGGHQHQRKLKSVNLPKLEKVGGSFILNQVENSLLKEISLPSLKSVGGHFCNNDPYLENIEIPQLESIGRNCCENNKALKEFIAPRLKSIGGNLFYGAMPSLTKIDVPLLENVVGAVLGGGNSDVKINTVSLPNLKTCGDLVRDTYNIENIDAPVLETVNGLAFVRNAIKTLILPKLKKVTGDFCVRMSNLIYVDLGALESVKDNYIWNCPAIKTLIIRSTVVPSIGGSICNQKPSDCILYVPDDMISKYLADSKWNAAFDKDHIKPISEAPQPPV
jgi:hypothetical protein